MSFTNNDSVITLITFAKLLPLIISSTLATQNCVLCHQLKMKAELVC